MVSEKERDKGEQDSATARRQRVVLAGAALGLYFGLFFRPVRQGPSLLVIVGLSLLSALLMTALRLRHPEKRAPRHLLRYGLATWVTFALFLAMLEGRHLAYDLGGRTATTLFTTLSGAGLGLWYVWTENGETR